MVLGYESDTPVHCLTHSYAIHTHYEVAPPYPQFVPHVSMACPGVALFNTGDSLVALDIRVDMDQSCSRLLSAQFASDLCSLSHTGSDSEVADDDDETVAVSDSDVLPSSSASALAVHSDDEQVTANTLPVDPEAVHKQNLSKLPVSVRRPGISNQQHLCVPSSETVSQHEDESHVDQSGVHCNTVAGLCAQALRPTHMKLTSNCLLYTSDAADE